MAIVIWSKRTISRRPDDERTSLSLSYVMVVCCTFRKNNGLVRVANNLFSIFLSSSEASQSTLPIGWFSWLQSVNAVKIVSVEFNWRICVPCVRVKLLHGCFISVLVCLCVGCSVVWLKMLSCSGINPEVNSGVGDSTTWIEWNRETTVDDSLLSRMRFMHFVKRNRYSLLSWECARYRNMSTASHAE